MKIPSKPPSDSRNSSSRGTASKLIGKRVGRLIVVCGTVGSDYFLCVCDCGNEKLVRPQALHRAVPTTSCGCKMKEMQANSLPNKYPDEYRVWLGMKTRCYNVNADTYRCYGGKGIAVSDEWRTSFGQFITDMGKRPSPDHQIDRKDGTKGYSANNCQWLHADLNRRKQHR